jgi:Icc-related predicted phosphoesterase
MTLPRSEKTKTQPRSRAVFIRIDTHGSRPLLELRAANELVTTYLFNFRNQGWFDLVAFAVLPKELHLIIIPRSVSVNTLVMRLEEHLGPLLCPVVNAQQPIWDDEIYSEVLEATEDIKARIQLVHAAPVKARLSSNPVLYDFSSANPRFQNDLDKLER